MSFLLALSKARSSPCRINRFHCKQEKLREVAKKGGGSSLFAGQPGQESDGHDGLPQAHLIRQYAIQPALVDGD